MGLKSTDQIVFEPWRIGEAIGEHGRGRGLGRSRARRRVVARVSSLGSSFYTGTVKKRTARIL
jgi:hypothetical protein